jgi:hypothetical protein
MFPNTRLYAIFPLIFAGLGSEGLKYTNSPRKGNTRQRQSSIQTQGILHDIHAGTTQATKHPKWGHGMLKPKVQLTKSLQKTHEEKISKAASERAP